MIVIIISYYHCYHYYYYYLSYLLLVYEVTTFQIIEVNTENVVDIDRIGWHRARSSLVSPCHVVVIRNVPAPGNGQAGEILALCDQKRER